jgi:hypothetical protein
VPHRSSLYLPIASTTLLNMCPSADEETNGHVVNGTASVNGTSVNGTAVNGTTVNGSCEWPHLCVWTTL